MDTLRAMSVLKPTLLDHRLLGVLSFFLLVYLTLFRSTPCLEQPLVAESAIKYSLLDRTVDSEDLNSLDCARSENIGASSTVVESDYDMKLMQLVALVVSPRHTLLKRKQGDDNSFCAYDILSRAPKRSPTNF